MVWRDWYLHDWWYKWSDDRRCMRWWRLGVARIERVLFMLQLLIYISRSVCECTLWLVWTLSFYWDVFVWL